MSLLPATAALALQRPQGRYRGEPAPRSDEIVVLQDCGCGGGGGCSCSAAQAMEPAAGGAGLGRPVLAIGTIEVRTPSLSVEKEIFQAAEAELLILNQSFIYSVISRAENLYLARELCWVMSWEGIESYVLEPASDRELVGLISAIAERPGESADVFFDVVTGRVGPMASPADCNGLLVPRIFVESASNFGLHQIATELCSRVWGCTPPDETGQDTPELEALKKIFAQFSVLTVNPGDTDEYRAVNFLVTRFSGLYQVALGLIYPEPGASPYVFTGARVQPSRIQGTRRIVDVIFGFRRSSEVALDAVEGSDKDPFQEWYARVDVTDTNPFVWGTISRYYEGP